MRPTVPFPELLTLAFRVHPKPSRPTYLTSQPWPLPFRFRPPPHSNSSVSLQGSFSYFLKILSTAVSISISG